nr:alpha-amylase family glycosyl hydrolase [Candidatus Krumholzibacteria bacterium]
MRRFLGMTLLLALLTVAGCRDNDGGGTAPPPPPPSGGDLQEQGTTEWWNDQIFYEVFVRSFYDSDGDGIGDLQGLIAKLDYLNDGDPSTTTDLGVTALWLMPVAESPSYHGYDATDYRTIEPDYGTNADFQELMSEAHARGMKVIVDYVMNHCSNSHPWFTASNAGDGQYRSWFTWSSSNPGWSQPWGGGSVWHYGSSGFYYGVFWSGMPDLNYGNPAVEAEMFDTATFWLNTLGADGFRLDAVKYMVEEGAILENTASTYALWGRFRNHLDTVAPEAFTVGEAWDNTNVVLQYIDAGLHTCFEFDLASTTINAVNSSTTVGLSAKVTQVAEDFPFQQYATFLTNHDQNRIHEQLGRNVGRNKVAAAILLTTPGVPFLYYGEEVGMLGTKPDENIRRPMQWTAGTNAGFTTGSPWHALNSNAGSWNVETLEADAGSLWNHYRLVIQARAASPALRRGTYHTLGATNAGLFAFLRRYEDDAVIAVHNLGTGTVGSFSVSTSRSQLLPGNYTARDMLTGADLPPLTVGANGSIGSWAPVSYLTGNASVLARLTAE